MLDDRGIMILLPAEEVKFRLYTATTKNMGPSMGIWAYSRGVNRLRGETNHSTSVWCWNYEYVKLHLHTSIQFRGVVLHLAITQFYLYIYHMRTTLPTLL